MKISELFIAAALSLSATVSTASTILSPTDGDVNFFVDAAFVDSPDLIRLAIFNDSEAVGPGGEIVSSTGWLEIVFATVGPFTGGVIDFTGVNPVAPNNYQASNGISLFDLDSINDNFIVGLSINGGLNWYADLGAASVPANSALLSFGVTTPFVVDVRVVPAVPVPAAVWLFGSGLIGLVGVARRRA